MSVRVNLESDISIDANNVSENGYRFETYDKKTIPDYVLIYKKKLSTESLNLRKLYEEKLIKKGLILEYNCPDIDSEHQQIYIYAQNDILLEYAELIKLRMPISKHKLGHKFNVSQDNLDEIKSNSVKNKIFKKILPINLNFDENKLPNRKKMMTAEFSRNNDYLFDVDSQNFFTQSERSMIVSYILELETFGNGSEEEPENTGLKKLIADHVYSAAYPLHDEILRNTLLEEWASMRVWYKKQPIDAIKDYFGVKIALYFAWLGFYTYMLIPASIFGLLCVLYGWATIPADKLSTDICNPKLNITMCPLCDEHCDYWNLTDACLYSQISHTLDNYLIVIFAITMSVWSSLYFNMWKSYSAEMVHRWGLSSLQPEAYCPRPEFLSRVHALEDKMKIKIRKKLNKVTQREEPVVPWRFKFPVIAFSITFALFWLSILMATILAILVFRVSAVTSDKLYKEDTSLNKYRNIFVPMTAALMDLTCILILNKVYNFVALWLTNREFLRTQSEFDDSLILKIYSFQFINYYSWFFYTAFVKGRFVGNPSEYTRVFGRRLEECNPGGCLMEMSLQLAIVMIGDQLFGQFIEYGMPYIKKKYNERKMKKHKADYRMSKLINNETTQDKLLENGDKTDTVNSDPPQNNEDIEYRRTRSQISENNHNLYENNDHQLLSWDIRGLFDEYLEMVIQYGFVTLFVTTFPLAPLCALCNNILEIRWDARKFLKDYRRPVAQTERDIGLWIKIINIIGKLAIVTNGFVIAFSSNFVPRLLYMIFEGSLDNYSSDGYLDWSLASFDTSEFENGTAPLDSKYNVTVCRYPDYRKPHTDSSKYTRSKRYWNILAARILFVLIYQNVVILCNMFFKWLVPEIPKKMKTQIMKEQWNLCKIITQHQSVARNNCQSRDLL